MDKFGEAYRRAVDGLPKLRLDAGEAQSELHRRRMRRHRQKQMLARGCTAAAAFVLLFGAGTAAAKNYRGSIISPGGNGFTITGEPRGEKAQNRSLPEAFCLAELPREDSEAVAVEEYIVEDREYNSLQEFLQKEDTVIAIPDLTCFPTGFEQENVNVIGERVFIWLRSENVYFCMSQDDNRGYESYSSATSYGGRSFNERSYSNRQGISFVMFDTMDETGGVDSTHAVLSINGRDLTLDFKGFEESVIRAVLDSMDLAVYFEQ